MIGVAGSAEIRNDWRPRLLPHTADAAAYAGPAPRSESRPEDDTIAERVPTRARSALTVTILGASSLTVMAGATISAGLPQLEDAHHGEPGCELLCRLVLTLPALAIAVVAPVAGALVDRFGRRTLLLAGLVIYAVAGTAGLWLDELPGLLASRAALGVAIGVVMTIATTLIGDHYDGAARRRFLGLQGAVMSLAGVVFLVGGGALAEISWRAPFALYAAALIVIPTAWIAVHDEGDADERVQRATAVRTPFSALFAVYGLAFSAMTFFYMVPVQLPFVLSRLMATSSTTTGIVIGGATVVSAVTAWRYRQLRDHLAEYGVAALLLALMGVGYVLIALAPNVTAVALAMLFVGAGVGLLVPHCNNWVLCLIPAAARGRALGGLTAAFFAGQFMSPLVAAPLHAWAGLQGQFVVAGSILVIAAVVFGWRTRVHARLA